MTTLIHADPSRCIGCRTCELACTLAHTSQRTVTPDNFSPRLVVVRGENISVPVVCHQCENAPCVAACPVMALEMSEKSVVITENRCIGCNSCVTSCPFGAISIDFDSEHRPKIIKCDLCHTQGSGPACINVCPTHALSMISSQLLEQTSAQRRNKSLSSVSRTPD